MDLFAPVQERLKPCLIPETQYYKEVFPKKSICLHHTAGGDGNTSIKGWESDIVRVATCVVIQRDGTILQAFGSQYWAYSLGLNQPNYKQIEQQTIGIEISNYGYLQKRGSEFYNAYGSKIKPEDVCDLGYKWRGYQYFENYTDAQIESVKRLLLYWADKYKIDLTFRPAIFDIMQRAIIGEGGVYTHASYRADKTDVYPYPKLIEMLKSLA